MLDCRHLDAIHKQNKTERELRCCVQRQLSWCTRSSYWCLSIKLMCAAHAAASRDSAT